MHLDDACAQLRIVLHAREVVGEEEHLRVADARHKVLRLRVSVGQQGGEDETRVGNLVLLVVLQTPAVHILFPWRAEGRIGDAEVEVHAGMAVFADGGAAIEAFARLARMVVLERLSRRGEHEVGLACGVGLGLQLLPVELDIDLPAMFLGKVLDELLRDGEDATRAAGAVVDAVGRRLQLVCHGYDGYVGQQRHIVAWREVLSGGGDAVLLVELSQQLLEERAHGVIVDTRQAHVAVLVEDGGDAQVDVVVGELLDDGTEPTCVGEVVHLLLELELVDDVLHVVAETVEILQKVLLQSDGSDFAAQRFHGEP